MKGTCPDCGVQGHLATFFAEDDGKRLAAVMAGMTPELGRATIAYLGLFKPAKTALRLARAAKLAAELAELASTGTVCRDERSGVRRPCSQSTWAAGIEQMLTQRGALTLPLENHNYLRAVVFGIADKADAAAERQKEEQLRVGKRPAGPSPKSQPESRLDNRLAWIRQQVAMDQMTEEDAKAEVAKAREQYGSTR